MYITCRSQSPFNLSALVLSSSVRSTFFVIFMWHSRLGHPSLPIFRKFLSVLSISFPKEHLYSFPHNSCNINKSHKLPIFLNQALSLPPLLMSFSLMFGPHSFPLMMVFTITLFLWTITQSISNFTRYVVNRMFIQPLFPLNNLLKTISPPPLKPFTQIRGANF